MKIEDVFSGAEGGSLTLEQFQAKAKEGGASFADLSEGNYVSISKHNSELKAKDDQINTLNTNLSDRDKDLASLQDQLKNAGNDAEKLSSVSADLSALQTKYDEDTKAFQAKLDKQARDFAIKEYAASKKFTSAAARRDYIANMQNADNVKLNKDGVLKGVSDFDTDYSKENADAFIVDNEGENLNPDNQSGTQVQAQGNPLPMFTQGTPGEGGSGASGQKESFGFSFIPQQS